jgi:hypothetical protein
MAELLISQKAIADRPDPGKNWGFMLCRREFRHSKKSTCTAVRNRDSLLLQEGGGHISWFETELRQVIQANQRFMFEGHSQVGLQRDALTAINTVSVALRGIDGAFAQMDLEIFGYFALFL